MNCKLSKKERVCTVGREQSGGFALLFAVLVSSLLLTVGLSIFSIALKELAISTATQRSIHAFYAADSGRECTKYWDTKRPGTVPTTISGSTGGNISCNGIPINLAGSPWGGGEVSRAFEFPIITNGPVSKVEIIKKLQIDGGLCSATICTTIISRGYDQADGDRVERAIQQDY
jgi:hypothetical protein